MYVYINGDFVTEKDAAVSIFDRGFLYGDGVFETLRAYNGKVFRLKEHLERLWAGVQYLKINLCDEIESLERVITDLLRVNHLSEAYIRITVTRGMASRGIDIDVDSSPTVIIFARNFQQIERELYNNGVRLILSKRISQRVPDEYNLKSINFLNNILAKYEATKNGAFDAIMLNKDGYITEGSICNIFFVKDRVIYTPSLSSGVLRGVTREVIKEISSEIGFEIKEKEVSLKELMVCDEVFITNTLIEIMPVKEIDGRYFEIGPITKKIQFLYNELVSKECGLQ